MLAHCAPDAGVFTGLTKVFKCTIHAVPAETGPRQSVPENDQPRISSSPGAPDQAGQTLRPVHAPKVKLAPLLVKRAAASRASSETCLRRRSSSLCRCPLVIFSVIDRSFLRGWLRSVRCT